MTCQPTRASVSGAGARESSISLDRLRLEVDRNRPDGRGCFAPWRAHGRLPPVFDTLAVAQQHAAGGVRRASRSTTERRSNRRAGSRWSVRGAPVAGSPPRCILLRLRSDARTRVATESRPSNGRTTRTRPVTRRGWESSSRVPSIRANRATAPTGPSAKSSASGRPAGSSTRCVVDRTAAVAASHCRAPRWKRSRIARPDWAGSS